MTPLKKCETREEDRYMWGCGRSPHPHMYPFSLLSVAFFSRLIYAINLIAPGQFFEHRRQRKDIVGERYGGN